MKREPKVRRLDAEATSEPDGRELTLAFQRGEKGAYQAVHDRYSSRVYRICRRMLLDPTTAEEAAQETFMRVYAALGRFNGRYQLGAWITRIATNVCLDHLRARARTPESVQLSENYEDEVAPDGTDPEEMFLRRSEGARVYEVLRELPPLHRAAIALRDIEGMSYRDIAASLEMTEDQVKALLHRARNGFKRSWISVGALLPVRWLRRIRGLEGHLGEPGAQVLSVSPQLSSCSMVIQQCGQFMTERVATVVIAAVIGSAAVAGGHSQASPEQPVEVTPRDVVLSSAPEAPKKDDAKHGASAERTDDPVAGSPAPVPAAEPTTEPLPEPESSAPPADKGEDGADPAPPPEPVSDPFLPSVYFGMTDPGSAPPPAAHDLTLDCARHTLDQRLETTIALDGRHHPAVLEVAAALTTGQVELRVTVEGKNYQYRSWGAQPVVTWIDDGSGPVMTISGEYGPAYGSYPEEASLPGAGTFAAELRLDCGASTVITESVRFTAE